MLEQALEEEKINYHADIQSKDEEIKSFAEEYFRKHEQETEEMRINYEHMEQSRLRQLIELEESERNLLERLDREK